MTYPPHILISDKLSAAAVDHFRAQGFDVDYDPELGKNRAALLAKIGDFDGLCIRSTTQADAELIEAATRLKVIGRAGIGVDNIDVACAKNAGILVMNTPSGNAVTTAEHTIAMLMASARQIAAADCSTQAGKWEKSRFTGVELQSKILGIIGCGNIGAIVADRALGLKMKVIAFDPYLTEDRAGEIGIEKVSLDHLLESADFISLHTPLTDETRHIIDSAALARMKRGAHLINCARGGLVEETALRAALDERRIGGAAMDVFVSEPARENILFGAPGLVCTPHLGASTHDAQENVARQIADQIAGFFQSGEIVNAINMPSIRAEDSRTVKPLMNLGELLGALVGQLAAPPVQKLIVEFVGTTKDEYIEPVVSAVLKGFLSPSAQSVNFVSAPEIAQRRGIKVARHRSEAHGVFEHYIKISAAGTDHSHSVAGTIFSGNRPRIIQIEDIDMEARFGSHMLFVVNHDKPGLIGSVGRILADADINIAALNLGRKARGGDAICLAEIDKPCENEVLETLRALKTVQHAKKLSFEIV